MPLTMISMITLAAAFVGVAALTAAVCRGSAIARREQRRSPLGCPRQIDAASRLGQTGREHPARGVVGRSGTAARRGNSGYRDSSICRRFIQQAGVQVTPLQLLSFSALLLPFWAVCWGRRRRRPSLRRLLGACVAGALPLLWLFWKRHQRLGKFESQMPDAMDLLARSLRRAPPGRRHATDRRRDGRAHRGGIPSLLPAAGPGRSLGRYARRA